MRRKISLNNSPLRVGKVNVIPKNNFNKEKNIFSYINTAKWEKVT
jgi:hypothetical protein